MTATVHYSPQGGCEAAIVAALADAKSEVRMMAYAFTSKPILEALTAAKARGVDVQAVLDWKASLEASSLDAELAVSVPVRLDRKHPIMHDKVMVIDERVIVTGSFNFTSAAENHNAENLLILDCEAGGPLGYLPSAYRANWQLHWDHSEPRAPHARVLGGATTLIADF